MTYNRRLKDHICERFDPRDTIWCFLRRAEEAVSSRGITLHLREDFGRLVQVNRENREGWFPLMPMFDPDCYDGGQAFWIEGLNELGETVSTQAERCYPMVDGSLADELMSLRLFYDDRSKAGETEACNCRAPSAFRLGSRICYSGGTWARPDFRGGGWARLVSRISRSLAFLDWGFDYSISLAEPVMVGKGVVEAFGYRNNEPGIEWVNSGSEEDLKLVLLWMDRTELLRDLSEAMVLAEKFRVSLPKSQGRSKQRSRSGAAARPGDPQAARPSVHAQRS